MKYLRLACAGLILCALPSVIAAAENVTISEFMASNTQVLTDEDGESSDWIEIHNAAVTPVNLGGWFLTDSPADLAKWRFPATNLNAGAYLIVFASNKDRRDLGHPLHANFRLNQKGNYLALVHPDGTNIASAFSPAYPAQAPNVSFGFGLVNKSTPLVLRDSPMTALVPNAQTAAASNTWTLPAFNDSSWTPAGGPAGFSATAAPDFAAASNLVLRLNFDAAPVNSVIVDTKPLGTPYPGVNRGADWYASLGDASSTPRVRSGVMQFISTNQDQITVAANADFNSTNGAISLWIRSGGAMGLAGGMLMDRRTTAGLVLIQTEDGRILAESSSSTVALANAVASTVSIADDRWHLVTAQYDQGPTGFIAIYIDGALNAISPNSAVWAWAPTQGIEIGKSHTTVWQKFSGALDDFRWYNRLLTAGEIKAIYDGDGGVDSAIGLNLLNAAWKINPTAYIRIPFAITNPTAFSYLQLRLQYDDGYIAWINGNEVGRFNAPDAPAWNAAATGHHASSLGEEVLIGVPNGFLSAGTNILAIQLLNSSAADPTMFLSAELTGETVSDQTSAPLYFLNPTPGAPNDAGTSAPGPSIVNVAHTPNVPKDEDDLTVTARISATFTPIADVVLHYRVMFDTELTTPMVDDGKHGDGAAGDGVYGAIIPANISTNGQMVRYFITASDTSARVSRWPLFLDKVNSPEYLGTVVNPNYVTSKIPIFHFFVAPAQLARVDAQAPGGRASVFFDGEFYDNIDMQLRGNSTAGFLKKSHRVNFNKEHPLRHPGPGGRIRKTSFEADYADPTFMRQGLSYWLCDILGAPAPFYYPVRLQLNGQFYQLANHNDVHGEELLQRLGYDPNGALYNAAGQVTPTKDSTGGFEKKTRTWQDDADYTVFTRAIREGQDVNIRRTNVFDMIDLPEVIDYMVAARWGNENDDVWANMSLYHDNDGDNLWRIVPFDMNLSWGAAFLDGTADDGIQATNDNHKSFPMYGSSQALSASSGNWNRMYDVIFTVPQTRDMYLRRLRTFLDNCVMPPGTPLLSTKIEQKILAWRDLIAEEADRDRAKWKWPAKGGQSNFDPGINLFDGVNIMLTKFFYERRAHFYIKHSILNTALPVGIKKNQNAGIPLAQPSDAVVSVLQVEVNPASGNQAHEFICITNANNYAVDLSGWKLQGAVDFSFKPGTVMPSNSVMYVSPDIVAFATRTTGPRRGQGLFVVGDYKGRLSTRGEALQIVNDLGRVVNSFQLPANPSPAQKGLRITEIMYHPAPAANGADEDFEYVELKNIGTTTLDLGGVHFTSGIEFTFPAGSSLAPGATTLLVHNLAAFSSRYGSALNVAGQFSGSLNNAGDRLTLVEASGEIIQDAAYNNSWQPITDGLGFSLVAIDENKAVNLWDKTNWKASSQINGTPGRGELIGQIYTVVVNELVSNPATGGDAVELFNRGALSQDVSGWYLTDDFFKPKKYRLPAGSVIPSGGFLVVNDSAFNPPGGANSFGFDADADEVYLFSANAAGDLTGYVHGFKFGATDAGGSFGRVVTSSGKEAFSVQNSVTLGATNSGPKIGPVIISEVYYHPADSGEFVELRNLGTAPANLWEVHGGIDFSFPESTTIPGGGFALLVNFDPVKDSAAAAAFRARYNLAANVQLFGPYGGKLSNAGETIRLTKPNGSTNGNPQVVIDQLTFNDSGTWPKAADGWGASLQRINAAAYGDDVANWTAAAPSPGQAFGQAVLPTITRQPASATMFWLHPATFSVTASGAGPLSYQWLHNGEAIPGATSAQLTLPITFVPDRGDYAVLVMSPGGAILSSNATLNVQQGSYFGITPRIRQLLTGGTASMALIGYPSGNAKYQWLKNEVALPGETSATLTLTNVQPSHTAVYSVAVTDDTGTTVSDVGSLYVATKPTIISQPQNITVLEGQTASMTVAADGTPPMNFRWRKGATILTNYFLFENASTFTIPNIRLDQAGDYNVVITNLAAGFTNATLVTATSTNFTITVLADSDRDGMPDVWETQYGLNPNNPADALLDLDGDGISNRNEYLAGTDPTDPTSPLGLRLQLAKPEALLSFTAASNLTYAVQFRDSLAAGSWSILGTVKAAPATRVETIHDSSTNRMRFYRIISPAP